MPISDYPKEEQVLLNLAAETREPAIREIADTLRPNPGIERFDDFVKDIFAREGFSTTGIGHGIGIPHARTEAVKHIVIALGRSRRGIDFGSPDGSSVRLIFELGTPKHRNLSLYLSMLGRLTRLLKRKPFRGLLLAAGTPAEVLEALR